MDKVRFDMLKELIQYFDYIFVQTDSDNFYIFNQVMGFKIPIDILLSKKYRIKKYQICEDEDKFYNTIKLYKKFFYRVFQFEITKSDDVFGEIERSNFYNNIMEIYSKYGKKNFDFNTKDYLYIMFIYNIINKQFKIIIYNGLSESDFVYLVNNVDKLIETII